MYDTYVTIVGNVLNPPEWRRTTNTKAMVTTFKISSTARRLDREAGKWVDGNSLRVRVSCWRTLASNVYESVTVGDPLIVTGRLYTRDWEDEAGNKRVGYELEATAVGHDLTRGTSKFRRVKPHTSTSAVEDPQEPPRVGGEPTEPVPAERAEQAEQAPARTDDRPLETSETAKEELRPTPGHQPFGVPSVSVAEPAAAEEAASWPDDRDPPDDPDPGAVAASRPTDPVSPTSSESSPPPEGEVEEEPGPLRRRGLRRAKVPA